MTTANLRFSAFATPDQGPERAAERSLSERRGAFRRYFDSDDDAAARTIAALDLDILIDLKGFTH